MTQSNSENNSTKRNTIKIPIVSKTIEIVVFLIMLMGTAGFVCLLIELGLFISEPENGYQPALKRYISITNSMTELQTPIFNEASFAAKIKNIYKEYVNISAVNRSFGSVFSTKKPWAKKISASIEDKLTTFNDTTAVGDWITNIIYVWYITTLTWVIKLITILSMSVPAFLIIGAGLVDGSVIRKIETFKGIRDTEDKHELWFRFMRNFGLLSVFLYMAIPNDMTAYHLMIPYSLMLSFLLRMTIKYYKKYF